MTAFLFRLIPWLAVAFVLLPSAAPAGAGTDDSHGSSGESANTGSSHAIHVHVTLSDVPAAGGLLVVTPNAPGPSSAYRLGADGDAMLRLNAGLYRLDASMANGPIARTYHLIEGPSTIHLAAPAPVSTAEVALRFVSPDGTPLPGVTVRLAGEPTLRYSVQPSWKSDGTGSVQLKAPAGEYLYEAFRPPMIKPSLGAISLPGGEQRVIMHAAEEEMAWLYGSVWAGEPSEDVLLTIAPTHTPFQTLPVPVAADGTFAQPLPSDEYVLVASKPGFSRLSTTVVVAPPFKTLETIHLPPTPVAIGPSIRVTDGSTGKPLDGAHIQLLGDWASRSSQVHYFTDARGEVSVAGFQPGDTALVRAQGFEPLVVSPSGDGAHVAAMDPHQFQRVELAASSATSEVLAISDAGKLYRFTRSGDTMAAELPSGDCMFVRKDSGGPYVQNIAKSSCDNPPERWTESKGASLQVTLDQRASGGELTVTIVNPHTGEWQSVDAIGGTRLVASVPGGLYQLFVSGKSVNPQTTSALVSDKGAQVHITLEPSNSKAAAVDWATVLDLDPAKEAPYIVTSFVADRDQSGVSLAALGAALVGLLIARRRSA